MPRATHGFAFGILFVLTGWGAAAWLSWADRQAAPAGAAAGRAADGPATPGPAAAGAGDAASAVSAAAADLPLWRLYERQLKRARYVDLTHTITPSIPVWPGFGSSTFGPALDPKTGRAYSYERDGFEATRYSLATDQLGTQLDPPAHWNPYYPAIDELPPTFAVRPLAVIPVVDQVARDPGYHLAVSDVLAWERRHGRIPEGAVVFVRSDWSKEWPKADLATRKRFPGVSLQALQFLHLQRKILMHGHEPLDTDTTPNLEGEAWLLRNGYTQAEGVANLDQVPEAGALVAIGYPKLGGGTGGYARYIAICPPDWRFGVTVGEVPEAPLARRPRPLRWDAGLGMRAR
jgi:kynurenine formamidase